MRAVWLQSAAWWGLLALAVPVVIHLLARQRGRALAFPSLRFLEPTRLAALRRRALSDGILLVVRLLVLAAAVAALAAPVFITPARRATWEQRTVRAIVEMRPDEVNLAEQQAASRVLIDGEREHAFASWTVIARGRATEAVAAAVDWLNHQPPAARELVVVGDIRAGLLTEADVASVPATIGIRFLPLAESVPAREFVLPVTTESGTDGAAAAVQSLRVTLQDDATIVVRDAVAGGAMDMLAIAAAPEEARLVAALAAAVLAEGLVLPASTDRRVIIELQGAPARPVTTPAPMAWMRQVLESVPDGGGEREGALVARLALNPSDPRAVHEVARIARAALMEPLDRREPRRLSAAALAAWSRPPGGVPESTPPGNEGDGRWLWLLVLALLAIEQVMRRRRVPAGAAAGAVVEVRVA